MIWYSLSVSVCAGATVIESPVCTPIGSRFSIEQTMMQLSLLSRTTSISNSFQPSSDSSISISRVGERSSPRLHHLDELVLVVGDAAAGAAERERRPQHRGEADRRPARRSACSRLCAMPERAEPRPMRVIAALNFSRSSALSIAFFGRADQLDVELGEHAFAREVERAVERGLPAHRRQQRVGPLALDDRRDHLPGDGLDVRDVRHLRVGHDRRRIAVDEDDAVALLAQRLARLRARIVELARLPDDDRAGADDEDRSRCRCAWAWLLAFHQLHEAVEQVPDVVRARARFRMALEAERRLVGVRECPAGFRRTATRASRGSSRAATQDRPRTRGSGW